MNTNDPKAVEQAEGINLENVTFDENGEVAGLADDVLDAVAGGVMKDAEGNNGCINGSC